MIKTLYTSPPLLSMEMKLSPSVASFKERSQVHLLRPYASFSRALFRLGSPDLPGFFLLGLPGVRVFCSVCLYARLSVSVCLCLFIFILIFALFSLSPLSFSLLCISIFFYYVDMLDVVPPLLFCFCRRRNKFRLSVCVSVCPHFF